MNIIQTIIGVGGLGMGIIALINPDLRGASIAALLIILIVTAIYLKIIEFSNEIIKQNSSLNNMYKKIESFKEQQDIYKKIYKLESALKNMKMKKGKFDPGWIIAGVVVIVLTYFILKTIGIL